MDEGAFTSMSKEWISHLAEEIKQKSHEAAETYGREQHRASIIAALGGPFFASFVASLEENTAEIKRQLQGDVTSSETTIQNVTPHEVKLARSRFPWFDAHITHQESSIIVDYAKGLGVAGDLTLDRKTIHFVFHVAADDSLSVQESFADRPKQFHRPEDLAKHVIQLLFEV
jgi:hypothetical protein